MLPRDCLEPEKHIAFPKNPRIKNKKLLKEIKEIGYCEYCGNPNNLEAHHITSKGAGGNDEPFNLICLCHGCHMRAHSGRIDREKLREIVRRRESYVDSN